MGYDEPTEMRDFSSTAQPVVLVSSPAPAAPLPSPSREPITVSFEYRPKKSNPCCRTCCGGFLCCGKVGFFISFLVFFMLVGFALMGLFFSSWALVVPPNFLATPTLISEVPYKETTKISGFSSELLKLELASDGSTEYFGFRTVRICYESASNLNVMVSYGITPTDGLDYDFVDMCDTYTLELSLCNPNGVLWVSIDDADNADWILSVEYDECTWECSCDSEASYDIVAISVIVLFGLMLLLSAIACLTCCSCFACACGCHSMLKITSQPSYSDYVPVQV